MRHRRLFQIGLLIAAVAADAPPVSTSGQPRDPAPQAVRAVENAPAGRTATRLSDGQILLLGGEGAERVALLLDPQTGVAGPTVGEPQSARAWHTATVLPNGSVLIIGGRAGSAFVEVPEVFDPSVGTFTPLSIPGAVGRSRHTATLLTDGRVLVAGGADEGAARVPTEIWDVDASTVLALSQTDIARTDHRANLLGDGRVLLSGGRDADGGAAADVILVDPDTLTVTTTAPLPAPAPVPMVTAFLPGHGATEVPLDARIAVRFSTEIDAASLAGDTVTLVGPDGALPTRVIAAEDGRLAFVWPGTSLSEATRYRVELSGLMSRTGEVVAPATLSFSTATRTERSADPTDPEEWIPNASSGAGGWRTGRPPSPWASLPPLLAPAGATAIAGQVLTLDGRPLADVTLEVEDEASTRTDRTGRFLLVLASAGGRRVLHIDGATASRPGRRYGFFEYGTAIKGGRTNVLPFTIWMPKLDTRNVVSIPSPTTSEVIVTTPHIPGLELHVPPRTMIRGEDGRPVTELSITPIPVDRPPFPLARNVEVPVYFTIQPGGAYVYTYGSGPKGAWLVYPNYHRSQPRQEAQFFHYEPDDLDWYVYGLGRVTDDGRHVVPNASTRLYEFTGAMLGGGFSPPADGATPGWWPKADPVDPSSGIFVMSKTDLFLPDVIPIAVTRSYNSGDTLARPFGTGMSHLYSMFLWSALQYQEADLILPDGGKIHFVRTSPGTHWTDAVFEHKETATTAATPTEFYKSVLTWNGQGWDLRLTDGMVYVFGENAPLQAIRDRYGNTVRLTRASGQSGNILQVTSPNGRWLSFTYAGTLVTQVTDNIGRTVSYTYNGNGNLTSVTDAENNVTTYTYDAGNRLATIKDGRNIVYLTNTYQNGRITQQTLADPLAVYQFAYTLDGAGKITQTDITNPRGYIERLMFNADRYVVSQTEALGSPKARTTTLERPVRNNLIAAETDALNRRTEYTYNDTGHVLTVKELAGTPDVVTTTYTYEPTFKQLATITDPLNHTWTWAYNAAGRLTSVTDPLTHQTTITMNAAGQVTQLTDPLQHTWQFGYAGGDLVSVTDPLTAVSRRFVDAGGRVLAVTDPLGRVTRRTPDKLNRVTTFTDALGGQTLFAYDPNGRVLSLTDALTHATSFTYDPSDRTATRTDPLVRTESAQYDRHDNLTQTTDRKGQVTTSQYDVLDRVETVTYADTSTVTYTYDAGDRVTQVVDSLNGTITRGYDLLDRLTSETTAQGTVSYTYDADGRRQTMTVAGQPAVTYGYDHAHRLTSVTQGASVVAITYDDADRRSTVTWPNGIVATSGYDAANQLTSLVYTQGATTLGTLTYTYDLAGQRTSVGGSWARTTLPQMLTGATYDPANRVSTWQGTTFTYDANGDLGSDGPTSYTWDARRQLAGLSGGASGSFAYDAVGRRRTKTVGGTTTQFLYDGANAVQELSGGGSPTANLVTGLSLDETFTRTESGGTRTLLTDALGSTVALTDAAGTVQTQYTYAPFGATTVSGATSGQPAQFTGREQDGTGLYYYRARYYDPRVQRFLSEDPLDFLAGDANLYAYVFNAPTMYSDPTGEAVWVGPLVGCLVGGGGSAAGDWWGGRKIDWPEAAAGCASGAFGGWGRGAAAAAKAAAKAAAGQGARRSGRGKNKHDPVPTAAGEHTTFKRGPDGRVKSWADWHPNPRNPAGWDPGNRYRGDGRPHGGLEPPLVHDRNAPGGVRPLRRGKSLGESHASSTLTGRVRVRERKNMLREDDKLERRVWTEFDFENMGWYDTVVWAIAFFPASYEFALDIDHTVKWIPPLGGQTFYGRWTAPATLLFRNVSQLRFDADFTHFTSIEELARTAPGIPHNADYIADKTDWLWVIRFPSGDISFRSTGFHQYYRREPVLKNVLSIEERGGISFARAASQADEV